MCFLINYHSFHNPREIFPPPLTDVRRFVSSFVASAKLQSACTLLWTGVAKLFLLYSFTSREHQHKPHIRLKFFLLNHIQHFIILYSFILSFFSYLFCLLSFPPVIPEIRTIERFTLLIYGSKSDSAEIRTIERSTLLVYGSVAQCFRYYFNRIWVWGALHTEESHLTRGTQVLCNSGSEVSCNR